MDVDDNDSNVMSVTMTLITMLMILIASTNACDVSKLYRKAYKIHYISYDGVNLNTFESVPLKHKGNVSYLSN